MIYTRATKHFLVIAMATGILAGCKSGGEGDDNEPPTGGGTANAAPSIWGDPATSVAVGSQYVFTPESEDPDGDVLTFEIDNKPSWADFSEASGTLQGVPGESDTGTNSGIVISVTDGTSVVSLAGFSITVGDGGGGGGGGSGSPPSISGKPNSGVVADTPYAFLPEASDPDGDSLSFSIVNKPSWASFNTSTGRLAGTPTGADSGTTVSDIALSVTDGDYIDSLQLFSITVVATGGGSKSISWTAPTLNDDGSELTDLAAYRIYYGTVPGEYNQTVEVNSSGVTEFLVENLASGTYYLAMTSINSANVESIKSGELTFEIS